MSQEIVARLEHLRSEVRRHQQLYYGADQPELTDAQFDALFLELKRLEDEHPELVTPESPTQTVGAGTGGPFGKVAHLSAMLSLQNAFQEEEIRAFDARVRKVITSELVYVCELKIDGLAISCAYREGRFLRAATRGDGLVGEDVTRNVRRLASLPRSVTPLPGLPSEFEVRGEVYMPLAAFERLNRQMEEAGQRTFMNPRNAAAGSVRQLDPEVTASRGLETYMYTLDPHGATTSQWGVLEGLGRMGFRVNPNRDRFDSIEGVISYHHHWSQHRRDLDHEIDGVVVKVDRHDQQEEMGSVTHSPRWAIAYKYAAEQATTQVLAIPVFVGRTGVLTPVAKLQPVIVGGVTVSNASLHNEQVVNDKGVYVGCTVVVQRAGDVIPEVVSVVDPRPGWRMPAACPVCGGEVVREEPYIAHRCINPFCPAQRLERLIHFASRGAMDIDGLGAVTLAHLIESGLVGDPSDIYGLKVEQLEGLPHHGPRSALKLARNIESSRGQSLPRLLNAIGIPQVGEATALLLAGHFGTLERLRRAGREELMEVPGIGPSMAYEISHFLAGEGGRLLDRLRAVGVRPPALAAAEEPGPFAGQTFVFTGTLDSFTRAEAESRVRSLGGRASGSVSSKTDYVVAGLEPGGKLDDARRLGVTVLDEEGFRRLLAEAGGGAG